MKRFTETEKWRDSWFRKLPPDTKLAYLFILDNADLAGVWDPDFPLANFTIGREVDWLAVQRDLGERLAILRNGKWWLTKFIGFQYGELSADCRPHLAVLRTMRSHDLEHKLSKGYPKGIQRDKDKDQDKDQDKDKDSLTQAEQIYAAYPRKVAKATAIKAIERAMEVKDPLQLLATVQAYAQAVAAWPAGDEKWVPHPATWFNSGRYEDDPATWVRVAGATTNAGGNPWQMPRSDHSKGF